MSLEQLIVHFLELKFQKSKAKEIRICIIMHVKNAKGKRITILSLLLNYNPAELSLAEVLSVIDSIANYI